MSVSTRHAPPSPRDAYALAELFIGIFRRDVLTFYPQSRFEAVPDASDLLNLDAGSDFQLYEGAGERGESVLIELFGVPHLLTPRAGSRFSLHDLRMIRAVGAVLDLRYHHLFQVANATRLELYRGGSEDHYIAAFIEPEAYAIRSARPSRIAFAIQTLRMAALSTYENRRVSTGALLLGTNHGLGHAARGSAPDTLVYGAELTSLKSIHRLCDGKRTLFLVDRGGKLVDIIDVKRWAAEMCGPSAPEVPCARSFTAHARLTAIGGHVCAVLSPNQEIKLFAGGTQAFGFAHGRWRILDPVSKFAVWQAAVENKPLGRVLFQTALDLAEARQGGLFVVVADPPHAVGRLIAPHDFLPGGPGCEPFDDVVLGDPLGKRALHYLARGREVTALDAAVLESLAGLDGALVTDRAGRLLAFGAILRHDAASLPGLTIAEGARTTAALVASRYGPVLKVSEDGVVSCFLDGSRVWDL
jgi:hypothetical protein